MRRPGIMGRMPSSVRVLVALLYATAAATVAVEVLNWAYAPEQRFGLAVRTGWAMLRSLGFLILVWHVHRGRAGARPFGLILAVTTVFAVGRLVVPRDGVPALPGVIGFAVLTVLCVAVVWLLYRAPALQQHLVNHPGQLVVDRQGVSWRRTAPRRPPVAGWVITSRIAAFTYVPLMLVPTLVSVGVVFDGRASAAPLVVLWFVFGVLVGNLVLPVTIFLLRGRRWARTALAVLTVAVLAVDLPLCWALLGLDGLIRDGAPLAVAAAVVLVGLWRTSRAAASPVDRPAQPLVA